MNDLLKGLHAQYDVLVETLSIFRFLSDLTSCFLV